MGTESATTKCRFGHDHESVWAALRCTAKTYERNVEALKLAIVDAFKAKQ